MNEVAKILNEIIDNYGFGCEFSKEELVNNFKNVDEVMESLTDNDLIEKNQLSGKYYLTDIFTCNNFLSQYLKEEDEKAEESIEKKYFLEIKKENLSGFTSNLKGFERNIRRMEFESNSDRFTVDLKISIKKDSLAEFENTISDWL